MRTTSGLWAHFTGGGGTGTGSEFGSLHMYAHTSRDTHAHSGTACVQLQVYAGRQLALVIYQLHSTQARTDSPPQQPTQHSTPELVPLQPVGEPREGEGGHRTLPTMGTSRCVRVTRSAKPPPATTDRPRHKQTEGTHVSWAIAPSHSAGLTLQYAAVGVTGASSSTVPQ